MSDDMDRLKHLEEEVKNLNEKIYVVIKKIDEQAIDFEDYMQENALVLTSAVEGMSIIRYYDSQQTVSISDLGGVFSCLKRLDEIRQTTRFKTLREFILERENMITGAFMELSKHKSIRSNEVLARFLEELGKEASSEIILLEDVTDAFGTEEAIRWKQMLG